MNSEIIPRRLWREINGRLESIEQAALPQMPGPLVILGEPGMGKTELLRWLGREPGYTFCTARHLKNVRPDPRRLLGNAHTLVIDALDELSARGEGDAVGVVLQRLGDVGYPNFVLSCRAADWLAATNEAAIFEQYDGQQPVLLHLERLAESEIRQLLTNKLKGDADQARVVIKHFSDANLDGLLANPQTLGLIARVADDGPLPQTKAELFERAVEILRKEHRVDKADLQPAEATTLDSAGAAFATLILTAADALVTQTENYTSDAMPLAEVAALPCAQDLARVIDSRLFATVGAGRFSYWHRSIGEYLGSRWLAQQANTVLKRKRILALFNSYGTIPASLRGIHAWLAHHSPLLAPAVIAADPMGLIEYGEVDALETSQASHLLSSLRRLAEWNPHFRQNWRQYSLKGLAQPFLLEEFRELIGDGETQQELRLLLIEAINGSTIAEALRTELLAISLGAHESLVYRLRAIDALITIGKENWPKMIAKFLDGGQKDEIRLAAEIIEATDKSLYSDAELVRVAISHAQCGEHLSFSFKVMLDELPVERLDQLLDQLVAQLASLGNRHERKGNNELNDLGYRLIERRLNSGPVDALRMWSWLRPLDNQYGYHRENRTRIHEYIRNHEVVRRCVQKFVLIDEPGPKSVWERAWRLTSRSPGFSPTSDDICILLSSLSGADQTDERWRDLLRLTKHSSTEGLEARILAKGFVANRPDMLAWIDRLADPEKPEWQLQQEERQRRQKAKRAVEWQEHRESYRRHIDAMRRGEYYAIICPAEVYLGINPDVDQTAAPQDRLSAWLGEDLAKAALDGFEAFLQSDHSPTASEIAESNAESKRWNAISIIIAGLTERLRIGRAFEDVKDDRLTAAFYDLQISHIGHHADKSGLRSAVEEAMQNRNLLTAALKAWIEPQLKHQRPHVDQLYLMMRNPTQAAQAAELAAIWLEQFPDMSPDPEAEMIDRLITSARTDTLRTIVNARLQTALADDRRHLWNAVAFIVDFRTHRDRLQTLATVERSWIWAVRQRVGGDRGRRILPSLAVEQLAWLIEVFRSTFPVVEYPSGVISGDQQPWDASDFLFAVARHLSDKVTEDAIACLASVAAAPADSYSKFFRAFAAEQKSKRTETYYRPPRLTDISVIVLAGPPQTPADLQATVSVLIEQIQKRVHANPANSWKGFYNDQGEPRDEEYCRDYLLTMLGEYPEQIDIQPEGHMAQKKRADLVAQIGGMRLPIEIKGQWHDELWHAADTQLDRLYTTDYAAERRGIFLVLWFGDRVSASKKLKSQGRGMSVPSTPEKLRSDLIAKSHAAQEGRVEIVVLDCIRPPA